jgi:hypothetical protein
MQLGDALNIAEELAYIVGAVIMAAGVFRALSLRGAFLTSVFRSRVNWMIWMLTILTVNNLIPYVPVLGNGGIGNLSVGEIVFVFSLGIILAFVDRNLQILREIDFFHRDTYGWIRSRKTSLAAFIAVGAIILVASPFVGANDASQSAAYSLIAIAYFGVSASVLCYGAVALVSGARRTPDRTMRTFCKFLGIALVFGILSFTIWIIPIFGNFISGAASTVASYYLYRSVMALSPVTRIEPMETKSAS